MGRHLPRDQRAALLRGLDRPARHRLPLPRHGPIDRGGRRAGGFGLPYRWARMRHESSGRCTPTRRRCAGRACGPAAGSSYAWGRRGRARRSTSSSAPAGGCTCAGGAARSTSPTSTSRGHCTTPRCSSSTTGCSARSAWATFAAGRPTMSPSARACTRSSASLATRAARDAAAEPSRVQRPDAALIAVARDRHGSSSGREEQTQGEQTQGYSETILKMADSPRHSAPV